MDAKGRYVWLDGIVLAYTAWVALLVLAFHQNVSEARSIVAFHLFVVAVVLVVAPRGAAWERASPEEASWKRHVRGGLRFFRYSYPLLLILFYFEEVEHTVHAIRPGAPHWFEPYLYAADRSVFGELPAILLDAHVGIVQNEILHAFYLSYYFILVGGVVVAWIGSPGARNPGPAFQSTLTSAIIAFFLCFAWYPFLPARGPWENAELMAKLTPFEGFFFVPLIERIIAAGSVSGGCFPSSHVAGSWGIVFGLGLSAAHRKAALAMGFFAAGMSFACVYTRYHHAVDVPAGFLAGLAGALIARRFRARGPGSAAKSSGAIPR